MTDWYIAQTTQIEQMLPAPEGMRALMLTKYAEGERVEAVPVLYFALLKSRADLETEAVPMVLHMDDGFYELSCARALPASDFLGLLPAGEPFDPDEELKVWRMVNEGLTEAEYAAEYEGASL